MLLRLWIRAADLWLEWNVKQLKIKVHLFFFIKKNNILPTKPPRTCTRIPVMLRSSYYLHFHFLRRHAGHAWDNLELRWWCCCCCSQFSQRRSGECRRRLPRPRRLSFCTVGVATQTLCHTLFSLSVCLPDGPWPSQPYLHLLAGPASHHRGRLLAGNTQLQSLCSRILHRGCGVFLSIFFLLASQRWQFTKPQTSDVRAALTLTFFVWCLSVQEETDWWITLLSLHTNYLSKSSNPPQYLGW